MSRSRTGRGNSSALPFPAVRNTSRQSAKPFQALLKPRGSICNLDCKYCYFLSKKDLYPGSRFHMSDETLEQFTQQYLAAQPVNEAVFGWQGGEPTLMGLDFFEKAITLQREHSPSGMRVLNTLQTNGTMLDDEWCRFLKAKDFLVGISIDGPQPIHDAYRVDKSGHGTFAEVMAGLDLLKKHEVEFNVLTTVHAANEEHGAEVYQFLRDEVEAQFIQFIPIVERDNDSGYQEGNSVTDRSVTAAGYGRFITEVFEEWIRRDVGQVFVQLFDIALAAWVGAPPGLCVFAQTCGTALAVEHNGDVYSCDHFVEPDHLVGNLQATPLAELVASPQQQAFGAAKRDPLPEQCRNCEVRFVCNGGCPKNRFITTADSEPGLNYLCDGYRPFFNHIRPAMDFMSSELAARRPPANVMRQMAEGDSE